MNDEARVRFESWKRDLEARCVQFLEQNPEKVEVGPLVRQLSNDQYELVESTTIPRGWVLWKNKSVLKIFDGPLAHRNALQHLNDLVNAAPPSSVPDRCLSCGNRFVHRSDCPNSGM